MKVGIWVLVFLFSCILMLEGCALFPKKDAQMATAILEPQAILKFGDVPVPVGFNLLSKESYAFESKGLRVGVLKYKGRANPDRVINFYKEQMPMYNWNLLNIIEYGERLMNFERENETCNINLSSKLTGVIITIFLGQKSQMPKKAEKPIK